MKTKTQFKQHNNKNTQPKKDNKKAKRVLLLLIYTIIFSFILTVANTLALFVHVLKDKEQDTISISTQEQQTAPPNYEYSDRSLIYYLDGLGNIGDDVNDMSYSNYFMVTITDEDILLSYVPLSMYTDPSNLVGIEYIGIPNHGSNLQFQVEYHGDGGGTSENALVYSNSQTPTNLISNGGSLSYIRYGLSRHVRSGQSFNVVCVLGIEFPDSPVYDFYIYFYFPSLTSGAHLTYGQYVNLAELEQGENYYVFTDTNPCILINPSDLADIIESGSNDYIIELRRQIQQLQNSTQQQVQDAYNQGRLDGEDIGYRDGYREGQNDANTYTFSNVIGSLIDGPVNAVMSLFDFEVLGVNLRGFFLSLITCALVIAIVKIFL